MVNINEAVNAHLNKTPIIAKWPFTKPIEYKCIVKINDDKNSVVLADKCGHSFVIANLKDIQIKGV